MATRYIPSSSVIRPASSSSISDAESDAGSIPATRAISSAERGPSPRTPSTAWAVAPNLACVARTGERSNSSSTSPAHVADRPQPEQSVGARRQRACDLPRHSEYIPPLFEREVGCDESTASLPRLHHHGRRAEAGDDPITRGEAPWGGLDAGFVFRDDQPVLADSPGEFGVRRRIVAIDATAEHGHRCAPGFERSSMSLCVDASSHSADDDET